MKSLFGFRRRRITDHTIVLVAGLRARPNEEKSLCDLLLRMCGPTRAERGCLTYELHQSKVDAGLFFVYQVWQDEAALDAHVKCVHTQDFKNVAPGLLEGPVLLNKWGIVM